VIAALAVWVMFAACDSTGGASVEQDWLAHEHDPVALEHILAPDFLHVLPTGQFITKTEHIGYWRTHPSSPRDARFERLDIRIVDGVAIATGIVAASDRRTAFTDIFACREGRWLAVGAQETPLR
jgi:uncharacterized protein DUF4440